LGKTYGINVRCYSEHLGGNIGNLMGTWREHVGNKGKMKKPSSPLPNSKLKRKKIMVLWVHASTYPLAGMYFWFPKLFVTIFGLG
jgi:hypothetical protein